MKQVKFRTFSLRKEDVKRDWHLVDAKDQVLGRLATEIAVQLTGKNKIGHTPHVDNGDYVVVINAAQVAVTGNKEQGKNYAHHTNFPGGFRTETLAQKRARKPEEIITLAVKNMLPKNRTRKDRLSRLKVFAGDQTKYAHLFKEEKAEK